MLNKIQLTNFRKHRGLSLTFGGGLTCIRGANEAAKSTILEAIAYALFGVKALRDSLSDVVTWGEAENTLKVSLEMSVDGVTYAITRSKSGCEIQHDGGRVTGQTECSNFAARLLKVDAGAAARLTVSSQLAIRGALEEGPKATTELIERLADFDQIDHLIELMQEKLSLGSPAQVLSQIESAQKRLDEASSVAEPDFAGMTRALDDAKASLEVAAGLNTLADERYSAAQKSLATITAQENERKRAVERHEDAQEKLDSALFALQKLQQWPVNAVDGADEEVQALMQKKFDTGSALLTWGAYLEVGPLLGTATDITYRPGTLADLDAEIDVLRGYSDGYKDKVRNADVTVATLTARLNSGNCTFCGKDFSDLPEVRAKNAQTQALIDEQSELLVKLAAGQKSRLEALSALTEIRKSAKPYLAAAQRHGKWLEVDDARVPWVLNWRGDNPTEPGAQPDYDRLIAAVRSKVKAHADYQSQLLIAGRDTESARAAVQGAAVALTTLAPEQDVSAAQKVLRAVYEECQGTKDARDDAKALVSTRTYALKDAQGLWDRASKSLASAGEDLESAQQALTTLEFNNALLKRVRQCRPLISDKLWSIVLAAVSNYFSEIRGAKSRVSKDSDGFKVDGHPITSMSGSTLDALGLAIRVALVRTFLPSAPFLILDEPGSAMDADRTGNMLGFLSSCGFQQILLVTHEEISSDVADHIISL